MKWDFKMRLDKFLSVTGYATRSEAGKAVRSGKVTVNGAVPKKADINIDPQKDTIIFGGEKIEYSEFTYILLNKPEGYVSATDDPKEKTVLELLPERLRRIGLFPCGRLDKNTVGLIILTNNGPLSHKLLSPKKHVEKEYFFKSKFPLSQDDVTALETGVDIGGYMTAPCKVTLSGEKEGRIILTEGKYHQIKLMLTAVHNQITHLERIRFHSITLPDNLVRGGWRYLTEEEQRALESRADSSTDK